MILLCQNYCQALESFGLLVVPPRSGAATPLGIFATLCLALTLFPLRLSLATSYWNAASSFPRQFHICPTHGKTSRDRHQTFRNLRGLLIRCLINRTLQILYLLIPYIYFTFFLCMCEDQSCSGACISNTCDHFVET